MYDTAPQLVIEARPPAIRFAKEIGKFANKWKNGGQMACMIAALALQNIVVSVMVELFPPGSKEGEDYIRKFYEGTLQDAMERWHAADLKYHFDQRHKPKG